METIPSSEPVTTPVTTTPATTEVVKQFNQSSSGSFFKDIMLPAVVIIVIIMAGAYTGYRLANGKASSGSLTLSNGLSVVTSNKKEVGSTNTDIFKDTATGRIEVNDSKTVPEGTHKLVRPHGTTQTAYLTSTVLDLSEFEGKCVEVWGKTDTARKAGWLMDIGRVKILDNCPEGL
jgi:hypothetical protein